MKGFVPTPAALVDQMVDRLFRGSAPTRESTLLDPGCGDGAFIRGVIRWCARNGCAQPRMIGIESEPGRAAGAQNALAGYAEVEIRRADFLAEDPGKFDFIIGNPPYVPITGLNEKEKRTFRLRYQTARGRFDLYLLFFERGIRALRPGGRLVFVTPEKFLYVETARPLRKLLGELRVEEIRLVDEGAFGDLVTYPTITTVVNDTPTTATALVFRDGQQLHCRLNSGGESWMPLIRGGGRQSVEELKLEDVCERVSCGVATGADSVFVRRLAALDSNLIPFAYSTIAGRELTQPGHLAKSRYAMLIPYDREGCLVDEAELGALGNYLATPDIRKRLLGRICVRRKPWYAFHETPVLSQILKSKILCKDIGPAPCFWVDRGGELVPRHSVYYIIPRNNALLEPLARYLNSKTATDWLLANCQRAANGFVRLQSNILKRLPIPREFECKAVREREVAQWVLPIKSSLVPSPVGGNRDSL